MLCFPAMGANAAAVAQRPNRVQHFFQRSRFAYRAHDLLPSFGSQQHWFQRMDQPAGSSGPLTGLYF